jgi:hypothetical protein
MAVELKAQREENLLVNTSHKEHKGTKYTKKEEKKERRMKKRKEVQSPFIFSSFVPLCPS